MLFFLLLGLVFSASCLLLLRVTILRFDSFCLVLVFDSFFPFRLSFFFWIYILPRSKEYIYTPHATLFLV